MRRVKSCQWLTNLAHEIGFRKEDVERYRHRKHTYTVACKGGSAVGPVAMDAAGSGGGAADGDQLPEGLVVNNANAPRVIPRKHNQPWLVPVVTCTVVEEPVKKRGKQSRLQMFTQVTRRRMGGVTSSW